MRLRFIQPHYVDLFRGYRRVAGVAPAGGFTLIELLVVIAIIGMLASVVLASLSGARNRAKDSQRIQNLKALQNALELYYFDHHQYPPSCKGTTWGGLNGTFNNGTCTTSGATGYIVNLAPQYIPVLPTDPDGSASAAGYIYSPFNNYQDYTILEYQTVSQTVPSNSAFYRCPGGAIDGNTPHTYAVWQDTCH